MSESLVRPTVPDDAGAVAVVDGRAVGFVKPEATHIARAASDAKRAMSLMSDPARTKDLRDMRRAFQGKDGTTIVFHDPLHADGGTVLKQNPMSIDGYWERLK